MVVQKSHFPAPRRDEPKMWKIVKEEQVGKQQKLTETEAKSQIKDEKLAFMAAVGRQY